VTKLKMYVRPLFRDQRKRYDYVKPARKDANKALRLQVPLFSIIIHQIDINHGSTNSQLRFLISSGTFAGPSIEVNPPMSRSSDVFVGCWKYEQTLPCFHTQNPSSNRKSSENKLVRVYRATEAELSTVRTARCQRANPSLYLLISRLFSLSTKATLTPCRYDRSLHARFMQRHRPGKIFVQPKKLQNPSLQDDEMEKRRNYSTVISALLLS
jgi:hypothetical protein